MQLLYIIKYDAIIFFENHKGNLCLPKTCSGKLLNASVTTLSLSKILFRSCNILLRITKLRLNFNEYKAHAFAN